MLVCFMHSLKEFWASSGSRLLFLLICGILFYSPLSNFVRVKIYYIWTSFTLGPPVILRGLISRLLLNIFTFCTFFLIFLSYRSKSVCLLCVCWWQFFLIHVYILPNFMLFQVIGFCPLSLLITDIFLFFQIPILLGHSLIFMVLYLFRLWGPLS